jgi:hypothetical protein
MRADDVPEASLARVSARIQEHIMTDVQRIPTDKHSRRPIALLGGLGLAGTLALAIVLGSGFGQQQPGSIGSVPTPSSDPPGGVGMASCLMYDPAILPTFDIVFDGSVTAIDGDQVTFSVNAAWKGVDSSVTLTSPSTSVALVGPVPDFEVGGRYLVTAAGSNINACGYTLEFDAETAATWAAAFGS